MKNPKSEIRNPKQIQNSNVPPKGWSPSGRQNVLNFGHWCFEFVSNFEFRIFVFKNQEGSLLLMSILILSGIVTSASSFAVITMQNLKQSIAIDNGIRAYYAAETGIEDGLYEIRKKETAVSSMSSVGVISNSGTWSRTVDKTMAQLTKDISENDFWEINLFDADSSLSALSNPIKSVQLSWTGSGSEWVQVQIMPWDSTGAIGDPSEKIFSAASNPIVNLQDLPNVLYRLRVKALYGDISDMTVTAYSSVDAQGSQVNIPGFLTMYSTGSFNRTNQVIRAQMPHRAPLSGNFGYVLFSEEDLIK